MIEMASLLLLTWGLSDTPQAGAGAPSAVEVPAVLVKIIEQVEVPAQRAGVLAEVHVREGDRTREGSPVAKVRQTEAELAVERAMTEVQIAQRRAENDVNVRFASKSLEVAKAELRRSEESNEKYPGSVSETEMDRLRLTVQKSALEVEQAEHEHAIARQTLDVKQNELKVAQEQLLQHSITAPLAGVVVQLSRRQGEWVEPGDTVIRLLRINPLRAEGFLRARDLQYQLEKQPVKLEVTLPGQTRPTSFEGRVVFIDPEIDPVNSQVRVWAEIDNSSDKLRPGMRGDMSIVPAGTR